MKNKIKKSIITYFKKLIFLIPFISICSLTCNNVCAAECPFGMTSDPFPGQCRRFTDVNNDNNCDLSESGQKSLDSTLNTNNDIEGDISVSSEYFIIPISIIILFFYILSYILLKRKIISFQSHKTLWGMLLFMNTLGSFLTGIILLIGINLAISFYDNIFLFFHVELSIIMVILTLIHIHIHKKAFINMFKFKWLK